jgi:Dynein light chain type 1
VLCPRAVPGIWSGDVRAHVSFDWLSPQNLCLDIFEKSGEFVYMEEERKEEKKEEKEGEKAEEKGGDIMESRNIKIRSGDAASLELKEFAVQFFMDTQDLEDLARLAEDLQGKLQKKFGGKWNVIVGGSFFGMIWSNKKSSLMLMVGGDLMASVFKSE